MLNAQDIFLLGDHINTVDGQKNPLQVNAAWAEAIASLASFLPMHATLARTSPVAGL